MYTTFLHNPDDPDTTTADEILAAVAAALEVGCTITISGPASNNDLRVRYDGTGSRLDAVKALREILPVGLAEGRALTEQSRVVVPSDEINRYCQEAECDRSTVVEFLADAGWVELT